MITTVEPATRSQASLFFAEARMLADGAYNYGTMLHVRGPAGDAQLVEACRRLHRATAALRLHMGIDDTTGDIVSWVTDSEPEVELRHHAGEDIEELVEDFCRRGFETEDGALARFLVLRTGPREAILVLVVHHLILDGLSHTALMSGLARAVTHDLPYDDGAAYTRMARLVRDAERTAVDDDRAYWFARVPTDLLSTIHLPYQTAQNPGGRRIWTFDETHLARLRGAAERAKVGMFRLLIAATHRAVPGPPEGRTVVCTAVSQRPPDAPDKDVTGCFINQIPLLATREPGDTVARLLARENAGWQADLRRRHFPFADLARRVDPHSVHILALDSVMVAYRRGDRLVEWRAGDITCFTDLTFHFPTPKTELTIRFFEYPDALTYEVQWGDHLLAGAGEQFGANLAAALTESF